MSYLYVGAMMTSTTLTVLPAEPYIEPGIPVQIQKRHHQFANARPDVHAQHHQGQTMSGGRPLPLPSQDFKNRFIASGSI